MILITGVAGFIGSNLLDYLIKKDNQMIIGIDNLIRGNLRNIKTYLGNKKFKFFKKDVTHPNFLENLNKTELTTIFHLASLTNARESIQKPSEYFRSIVIGTFNVLELARKKDSKIVFPSSAAVYGNYKRKVKENDKPRPISPYGVYKLLAEKLILSYHQIYGVEFTIFRIFNVYGPRARDGIIKILVDSLKNNKTVEIFGGHQRRDFIYVKDVIKIIAMHEKLSNDIFNLGTGRSYSILQLIKLIEKISGKKLKIRYSKAKSGDIEYSCADNSKLLSKINFKFTTLEKGLRDLLKKHNEK